MSTVSQTSGKIKDKLFKAWDGLPTWGKGVVGVAVATGLFFVGKKVYEKVFPSDSQKNNALMLKTINNEIDYYRSQGMINTFPESSYFEFANTCYEGMRYAVGDNYGAVEDTLKKMNNDLDVALLIKAFGSRQNYVFGIDSGSPMDLFTFVQSELGSEWAGLTSYRVNSINNNWAGKGITYKI